MAAGAPVRRGRRTALASRPRTEASAGQTIYVCTDRALPFGSFTLTKGVEVPGAASWTRLDSWVGARRVRKIEPGETFVAFLEFAGSVCEALLSDEQRHAERTITTE